MKRIVVLALVAAAMAAIATAVIAAPVASPNVVASVSGGGHYLVAGSLDVQFGLFAAQFDDGNVAGSFHDRTNDGQGLVDFDADVTCLAIDAPLGRAWVGGKITANRSTSPDFVGGVFEPGHDIWFRVLDSDSESNHQDRRTFVGFEGTIPSSAAYCELRPWAPDNARTWPVTKGNIQIVVR